MSSTKKEATSMSVRIDDEVVEWITLLKDAFKVGNMSDAIRQGLLRAYPELPIIAEKAKKKEAEREAMLGYFTKGDSE